MQLIDLFVIIDVMESVSPDAIFYKNPPQELSPHQFGMIRKENRIGEYTPPFWGIIAPIWNIFCEALHYLGVQLALLFYPPKEKVREPVFHKEVKAKSGTFHFVDISGRPLQAVLAANGNHRDPDQRIYVFFRFTSE